MKILKKIINIIVFLIILLYVVIKLGNFVKPTWNDEWINTAVVQDFYKLKENSIDVLAVGSSQLIKGFSALELYKNFGISAYGIGTEQQSVINSYAWIKESLKTQNEKVILYEVKMLFEETPEPQNRKGLDNMKISLNKMQCIYYDSLERNSFENFVSLLFPITRFHSRWNEVINENNTEQQIYPNYRGYSLANGMCGVLDYKTLDENITEKRDFYGDRKKHLEKIIKLCKKENIKLIFYKNPDLDWDMQRYNAVLEIAKENDIPYFDFNLKQYNDIIDFDYAKDCQVLNHLNIYGAEKVSNYLGQYIVENCEIENKKDNEQYSYLNKELDIYNDDVANKKLVNIFDVSKYIDALNNNSFTIMIAKNSGFDGEISNEFKEKLSTLGVNVNKIINNKHYCAIIENGKIAYEEGKDSGIKYESNINNKHQLTLDTEGLAAIIFDDVQYSNNHTGLNLLIYNHKNDVIIECSYIDYNNQGIALMGR